MQASALGNLACLCEAKPKQSKLALGLFFKRKKLLTISEHLCIFIAKKANPLDCVASLRVGTQASRHPFGAAGDVAQRGGDSFLPMLLEARGYNRQQACKSNSR